MSERAPRTTRGPDFQFKGGQAGYFTEPLGADPMPGTYGYMPYRSGAHLAMAQALGGGVPIQCTTTTTSGLLDFAVRSVPEYGVLDVGWFMPVGVRMSVRRWDPNADGPLDEPAIRALHQPPNRHRISVRHFDSGTSFGGSMRAGICYVLAGHCRYAFGERKVEMGPGDVAELPQGTFEFQVLGDERLTEVVVWKLPFEVP